MNAPVSVIIPTFNRSRYIAYALSGIFCQTLPPNQIIVVDDGSTDDTVSKLAPFKDKIDYVYQNNAGKSAALNRALPLVREKVVWIFDDDDIPFSDALHRHIKALNERPDAGFTYSSYIEAKTLPDGTVAPAKPQNFPDVGVAEAFPRLLESCYMNQQGSVVRTECIESLGGFREDLIRSLDYDYLLRLARNYPAARLDEPTFYLRVHSGTRGTKKDTIKDTERGIRWYQTDKTIFRVLYKDLALWEYLPHIPGSGEPISFDLARALLVRIRIMGQKGLWDYFMIDLREMISNSLTSHIPTSRLLTDLMAAFSSQYAVRELANDLYQAKEIGQLLRQILPNYIRTACAQKVYYWIYAESRNGTFRNRYNLLRAAITIGGAQSAKAFTGKLILKRPVFPNS